MFEKVIFLFVFGVCLVFVVLVWVEGDLLDNFKLLVDDVVLLLLCGGEMVFWYVYVFVEGVFDDCEVNFGYVFNEGEVGY